MLVLHGRHPERALGRLSEIQAHDGILVVGVIQTQCVANLMDSIIKQALGCTPESSLFSPFFAVIKMNSSITWWEGVGQNTTFSIEHSSA